MRFSAIISVVAGLTITLPVLAAPILELPTAELSEAASSISSKVQEGLSKVGKSSTEDANGVKAPTDSTKSDVACTTSRRRRGICGGKGVVADSDEVVTYQESKQATAERHASDIVALPKAYQDDATDLFQAFDEYPLVAAKLRGTQLTSIQNKANDFLQTATGLLQNTPDVKSGKNPLTWGPTGIFEIDMPNIIADLPRLTTSQVEGDLMQEFNTGLFRALRRSLKQLGLEE